MADMKDIVKLAVDGYKGRVEKYSVEQSQDTLRQALIEANNGKTSLNYKDIRDGKCSGLFTLIEEILSRTVVEGLQGDEFFNSFVDFRNVAEGDQNVFLTEDNNLFVVAEAADGTQGIRRQRLSGVSDVSIPTTLKVVRIYEELNRVLAGRVDFNAMIAKVSESFKQKLLNDIYGLWSGATQAQLGGATYYPNPGAVAGTYSEDALLDLIAHVEAGANGQPATIIGTKKAVRNLYVNSTPFSTAANSSQSARENVYNNGFYGKFYGTDVIAIPQRHKVGTTQFVMPDNVITVVAGSEKPLKLIYEGDPIMIMGNPIDNADFTQEYFFGEKWGTGIILSGTNAGIGRYEIA